MEFTSWQLFLFFLRGILLGILPFAGYAYLRKKYGTRFFPMLIGFVTVNLLIIPRALLRHIFSAGADTDTGKWLTIWLIGAACEEFGRYLAMKTALQNYDSLPDTICYGLGHGGSETLMSAGLNFVLFYEAYTQTGDRLEALLQQGIFTMMEVVTVQSTNLVFHAAMSILIARAVHYENCKKLIPIAIFLHLLSNFTNFCFGGIADIMLTALICVFVYFQGKQLQEV